MIASPVYWYSLSGLTKRYLDYWSDWLRVPGADFKATMAGRTLWGVSALADDQPVVADPLIGTLNNSAAYLKMRFGGVLLGNGSAPETYSRTPRRWPGRRRSSPRRPRRPASPSTT